MLTGKRIGIAAAMTLVAAVGLACWRVAVAAEGPEKGSVEARAFHGWAKTPPMGWNSWDCWGCTATEEIVKANADYMAEKLARHGWQYVVVDIQWYEPQSRGFGYHPQPKVTMDGYGRLFPVVTKHPSAADGKGFKPLADYVHGKGLKFGVHLLRGIPRKAVDENTPILGSTKRAADIADKKATCPWNPDMYGVDMAKEGAQAYYNSVFKLLAEWGVDFVKVDDLSEPYHTAEIEGIRKAIDACGRPIVFSTSPGDTPLREGAHVAAHANMWRISGDFWDDWKALRGQFDRLDRWTPFRGEGHWPDADMLPIGNVRAMEKNGWTHFTHEELYTLITLWSIARSPLMIGGHMPKNDEFTLALLTNDEVLAVNQKSANNRQLFRKDDLAAWVADVPESKDKYLAVFNLRGNLSADAEIFDESKAAFRSAVVNRQTPGQAVDVDVDITGAKKLFLVVTDGGDDFACDHADWAEPRLVGPDGEMKLTELKPFKATAGWGDVSLTKAVGGGPLTIDGKKAEYGIGTHSPSVIGFDLPPGVMRFKARAGLDKGGVVQNGGATVRFLVYKDAIARVPIDPSPAKVAVPLKDLGFEGACTIRDLWKQKEVGRVEGEFAPTVPQHGAGLYRISP